ncbi:DinB family protein [Gracilibacillus suaedae]|uniref:DinB family protein n=1 Tax=Gracilibacillus suaedae TaxID=2820273 RepID=UPI001ABE4D0D|nr:DinB family protein [Gracilibacillus suaedae]
MSHYLVDQIKFVRNSTLNYVKDINERYLDVIPVAMNNNIRWNLGHIYLVTEIFAFQLTGEETNIPTDFPELFKPGTSPRDWSIEAPGKEELLFLLNEQRIKVESLSTERIEESIKEVYTTSTGLEINKVKECLSFCLYHEGMHFGGIKSIYQQISK